MLSFFAWLYGDHGAESSAQTVRDSVLASFPEATVNIANNSGMVNNMRCVTVRVGDPEEVFMIYITGSIIIPNKYNVYGGPGQAVTTYFASSVVSFIEASMSNPPSDGASPVAGSP